MSKIAPVAGWACIVALVTCVGCATPPPPVAAHKPAEPATTVVLLPDDDGTVGTVTVTTTSGDSRKIDSAFQSVAVMKDETGLAASRQLDASDVTRSYANLLKAEPTHPTRFVLYFRVGADLQPESQAAIAQIIKTIQARSPTEVSVIGHTDTTGTDEINGKLARERAITVEKILKDRMPALDRVTVRGFGSRDLLVPTAPNVMEPRNRRVEVVVL